jgi:hypothetical protein
MIRLAGTGKAGRKIMIFGLSERNLTEMRAGHPVHVHCDDLGFSGEVVIFWGETEDKIAEQLKPLIGEKTRVTDWRQQKRN